MVMCHCLVNLVTKISAALVIDANMQTFESARTSSVCEAYQQKRLRGEPNILGV